MSNWKLDTDRKMGKELRQVVVETLQNIMNQDQNIVAFDADLGGASGWTKLLDKHPRQFINMGISEANMVGVAAGMSLVGYIPYIHTFGPFATRRVFDQLYLSVAYAKNTINIYGSDPGFTVGPNGGTHTTWEDVALIRTIPDSLVCDAADETQMKWIVENFSKIKGLHYVRSNRKSVRNVYKEGSSFVFGKGNLISKGQDVLLVSAGQLVSETIDVAEAMQKVGVSCSVIDMFTIKPIDKDLLLREMEGKRLVVSIENHSIIGGLGSAISEVMTDEAVGIPLLRIGANDCFGQVGTPKFLQEEYKLTSDQIYERVFEKYSNLKVLQ